MKIIKLNEMAIDEHTSVCLGFFDGIHLAHKKIIENTVSEQRNNLVPTLVTFNERPFNIINGITPEYITKKDYKYSIIESLGIKNLIELDFNKVKSVSKIDFVNEILFKKLNAKKIFCGFNFTFGENASGNLKNLKIYCEKLNIDVLEQKEIKIDGVSVSSTNIRKLIKNGNIDVANRMLGRNFFYKEKVIEGKKLARQIGFPTINQSLPKNVVCPRYGVYRSRVFLNSMIFDGISNIGIKPTFNGNIPLIETHILNYAETELYGKKIKVEILNFIRDEIKFENINDLKSQIKKDVNSLLT